MRIFLGTQNIYFIRIESASIGNILKRLQKKNYAKIVNVTIVKLILNYIHKRSNVMQGVETPC